MAIHYRTLGVVIKKEGRLEADQLLTIYTKDYGKLEIIGRAIRKISSKLRAGAELFYLSEVEFIQGKTNKTLTDASVIDKFSVIRGDQQKLDVVSGIADLLNSFIKAPEPDKKIWSLLQDILEKLNEDSLKFFNIPLVYYYFFWSLVAILGHQSDFYHCSVCQKKLIAGKIFFDFEDGLMDSQCCQQNGSASKIGAEVLPETIKVLRLFLKNDWQTLARLKMGDIQFGLVKSFSESYNNYLTSK